MHFIGNQNDLWYKENWHIGGSSSWDHFFMDGDKYHESYFDPETGEFLDWLKAFNEKDFERYNYITEKCPRVVHLKCHKDFDAVKRYYKKKKNII